MKAPLCLLLMLLPLLAIAQTETDPNVLAKKAATKVVVLKKEAEDRLTMANAALEKVASAEAADKKAAMKSAEEKFAAAKKIQDRLTLAEDALKKAEIAKSELGKLNKLKENLEYTKELHNKAEKATEKAKKELESAGDKPAPALTATLEKAKIAEREAWDTLRKAKKEVKAAEKKLEESVVAANMAMDVLTASEKDPEPTKAESSALKEFSPFRLWLGTNLDLLDGVKSGRLYGNLDFTTPLNDDKHQVLLSIGAFQNRTMSVDSSALRTQTGIVPLNILMPPINDSIDLIYSNYTSKVTTTVNNLGFYANYAVRLLSNGDSYKVTGMNKTMRTVNIYAGLRSEIIRQQFNTKYDYTLIEQDTIRVLLNEGRVVRRILAPGRSINRYYGVIGIGTPIIFVTDAFEVRFSPFVGMAFNGECRWTVSSLGFSVTEKQIGLSIGGEVRTLGFNEPPLMNLFIAKSFTIKDFKELIKFD